MSRERGPAWPIIGRSLADHWPIVEKGSPDRGDESQRCWTKVGLKKSPTAIFGRANISCTRDSTRLVNSYYACHVICAPTSSHIVANMAIIRRDNNTADRYRRAIRIDEISACIDVYFYRPYRV